MHSAACAVMHGQAEQGDTQIAVSNKLLVVLAVATFMPPPFSLNLFIMPFRSFRSFIMPKQVRQAQRVQATLPTHTVVSDRGGEGLGGSAVE